MWPISATYTVIDICGLTVNYVLPLVALFAAKSCRRKERLPLRALDVAVMVPLLLVGTALASWLVLASRSGNGGGRVKRKVFSMRMIWPKFGRMLGSSTQHDCTMNTSSGGVSSGKGGRICFLISRKKQRKRAQISKIHFQFSSAAIEISNK